MLNYIVRRVQLGIKRVTPEAINKWKQERGYDKPLMFNHAEDGLAKFTHTIFFEKSAAMFAFRFGPADDGQMRRDGRVADRTRQL